MKAGRLFEDALKQANIALRPGVEMKIKVRRKGKQLYLLVQSTGITEFEASILDRSQKANRKDLKPYIPTMPVGERIRVLRKAAGLTLDAAASKAGMTKGSLCSIENGKRAVGLAVLKKISGALGVSITILVE